MWTIKLSSRDFSSTRKISLPFLFHVLMKIFKFFSTLTWPKMYLFNVFVCQISTLVHFTCYFSICFGPNYWAWRKYLFTWIKLCVFFFAVCHLVGFIFLIFHRTGPCRLEPLCKIQTSTIFSIKTHFHSIKPSVGCVSSIDACAWNFLHCFILPMLFHTWHEIHWNCNVVVAQ